MNINGIYQHFKGNKYKVHGSCTDSNSEDIYVLYEPLDSDSGFWIREHSMFFEKIERDGKEFDRFSLIKLNEEYLEIEEFYAKHSETLEFVKIHKIGDNDFVIK